MGKVYDKMYKYKNVTVNITLFIKTVFNYFKLFVLFSIICIDLYCFPGPSLSAAQYPDQASPPWSP